MYSSSIMSSYSTNIEKNEAFVNKQIIKTLCNSSNYKLYYAVQMLSE